MTDKLLTRVNPATHTGLIRVHHFLHSEIVLPLSQPISLLHQCQSNKAISLFYQQQRQHQSPHTLGQLVAPIACLWHGWTAGDQGQVAHVQPVFPTADLADTWGRLATSQPHLGFKFVDVKSYHHHQVTGLVTASRFTFHITNDPYHGWLSFSHGCEANHLQPSSLSIAPIMRRCSWWVSAKHH